MSSTSVINIPQSIPFCTLSKNWEIFNGKINDEQKSKFR